MAKRISDEVKMEAVRRANNGESAASITKDLGVHPTSISKWKRQLKKPSGGAKKKAVARNIPRRNPLKEENTLLKNEIEFWKDKYTKLLYERNS